MCSDIINSSRNNSLIGQYEFYSNMGNCINMVSKSTKNKKSTGLFKSYVCQYGS